MDSTPKHGRKGLHLAQAHSLPVMTGHAGHSIKCFSAGRKWGTGSQLHEHTRAQQALSLSELTQATCHRGPWGHGLVTRSPTSNNG